MSSKMNSLTRCFNCSRFLVWVFFAVCTFLFFAGLIKELKQKKIRTSAPEFTI